MTEGNKGEPTLSREYLSKLDSKSQALEWEKKLHIPPEPVPTVGRKNRRGETVAPNGKVLPSRTS